MNIASLQLTTRWGHQSLCVSRRPIPASSLGSLPKEQWQGGSALGASSVPLTGLTERRGTILALIQPFPGALLLSASLRSNFYYSPQLPHKETRAQRGEVTGPRSHSQ